MGVICNNRILHLLDDTDIEYVCQQYINIKGNKHYLTDLCFPSLKLYYEIDEGQHASKEHGDDDKSDSAKFWRQLIGRKEE